MKIKSKEKFLKWNTKSKRNIKTQEILQGMKIIWDVWIKQEFMKDMKPQILGNTFESQWKQQKQTLGKHSIGNVQDIKDKKQPESKGKLPI